VRAPLGIALNLMPAHPITQSEEDLQAAHRHDGYFNRWFVEPLLGRGYPSDMLELYAPVLPKFDPLDFATIARPIDLLGINYYERAMVGHGDSGILRVIQYPGTEFSRTADREIYPDGLGAVLRRMHSDYGFQRLVVTENGAAFADAFDAEGRVPDTERVAFFRAHLEQIAQVRREGVPVDAFFAWSLMDNFEWSEGYTLRYGLVHVDFESQRRTPKASAHFLRSLAAPRAR